MLGATTEASALDDYYAAIHDAKQLVEQNLWDKGMGKWDRALNDVAPQISLEQLNAFRWEFDNFFLSRRNERALRDNADSDSSEKGDGIEDGGNEGGNDSPDVDGLAIIEGYRTEHMKLVKRHTIKPRRNILRMPSRSSTISIPEPRGTAQSPRTSFRNDDD
ncbi:hypothetical protein F5B21DRAFT_90362 [Xylaria acuta]|nr:hypothetical protein F5B21DRAFT_90362 [Xylaria acuta]